ncbi:MAG: Periplasmic pH-dependent serine endoprotease DegQ precursor [Chloroflexi bacterium ADurb.Bin360]|nr:MAG: Periplasmic pH-dependent serine endoprotease DegQ precursor [Chloroflexi bacterium ADurb.Bin360]
MNNKRLLMVVLSVLALLVLSGCNLLSLMTAQAPENAPLPEQDQTAMTENQMTTLPDQAGILSALQTALETIYADVNPSVVSVQVTRQSSGAVLPFSEESAQPSEQGAGSGFVWDNQGHIVTNYHVIENATRIVVRFADDTTAEATVVGSDPDSDLAVLKVDVATSQLQPVRIAQTEPAVGQLSVAIGNPFGLENTMTVGFISAIGRSLSVGETLGSRYSIPDIIQTDAPINPGNSGGVLVNEKGEVIGVTAAIISPVQASVGIGFAIPAAIVERVVPVLIETGAYAHPWIGISGTTLTADLAEAMELPAEQRGALVIDVIANSPAEQGEVRGSTRQVTLDGAQANVGGDVIIALDATPIHSFEDLISALSAQTRPGQTVVLTVLRDGAERELHLTLGERPKS